MLYEAPLTTSARSPPPEFQAVVLAGPGKDLYPLTPSTSLPKALLPVGNKPIIDGVLRWIEEGGISGQFWVCVTVAVLIQGVVDATCSFKDVLLLAPQSQQHALASYLRSRRQQQSSSSSIDASSGSSSPSISKVELECYDDAEEDDIGTAGVLAFAASKGLLKVNSG
jgi:hypothetical protein